MGLNDRPHKNCAGRGGPDDHRLLGLEPRYPEHVRFRTDRRVVQAFVLGLALTVTFLTIGITTQII